jgi:DNA ligase 1
MNIDGAPDTPLWIEDKYDGIRCQLHKHDRKTALYSRDLKDITSTFHEIAAAARAIPADVILDGEVLAMRGDTVLPFAELQRRLGRREHDLFMGGEIPVTFVAFDILWKDGASVLKTALRERRKLLESLGFPPSAFQLARITPVSSVEEIEAAFTAARARNNEGLMVKDPESSYSPGRRGLAWVKLKKAYATLDCVVVGAEYGHGKRNKVLSDYTFAVRDDETGELKTIGKAYSGLTDVEIAGLTKHFLDRTIRQYGRFHEIVPDTVLEVAFDKLQPSDRHSSGLAMRFPRILRIRTDKTVAEIDTVASARRLVSSDVKDS